MPTPVTRVPRTDRTSPPEDLAGIKWRIALPASGALRAMPEQDRALAVAVHQIVTEVAPELEPRTWYGMPAYARGTDVLVFLQVSSKFDVRYATLGFNESAALDDGPMWPTAYALTALNDDVRARIADLVRRAVG